MVGICFESPLKCVDRGTVSSNHHVEITREIVSVCIFRHYLSPFPESLDSLEVIFISLRDVLIAQADEKASQFLVSLRGFSMRFDLGLVRSYRLNPPP